MNKFLWRMLFLSFLLTSSAAFAAEEPEPPGAPPLSPAFLKWQQKQDALKKGAPKKDAQGSDETWEAPPSGVVPSPIDRSHLRANPPRPLPDRAGAPNVGTDPLPSSYDQRTWYGLPPIRNQGDFGTCWAHAAIGSVEANAISRGFTGANAINLSEMFLAYFVYWDSRSGKSFTPNPDKHALQGGNSDKSTAFMSRQGAVNETDCPYPNPPRLANYQPLTGIPEDYPPSFQLRETYHLGLGYDEDWNEILTDENQRNLVKRLIQQHGAVEIYYDAGENAYSAPSGDTTTYYTQGREQNHAVLLVGWDDNFSRTNFGADESAWPQNNGAWLVRNSWGGYGRMGGYFWMSYEQYIGDGTVYIVEPADNSLFHYGYDDLGQVSMFWQEWAANVFRAKRDETVQDIAFYTTSNNAQYKVYIYDLGDTGDTAPSNPKTGGTPLAELNGTVPNAGYHRVALSSPVDVDEGHWFSVVVKMTTPGYSWPTAIETSQNYSNGRTYADPVVNAGESWFSSNGTSWTDGADGACYGSACNAAIKAFTSVPPLSILTDSLPDGFLGKEYSHTLTAKGAKPIKWTRTGGALPTGLTLAEDGTISGTPTELGDFRFTVKADNNTEIKTKELMLTISEAPVAPTIQTEELPKATLNESYEADLQANGTAPITWTRVSGTLPNGLTLSPDGSGHISGTPTREGAFTFKVKAKNDEGEDTKSVTIKVGKPPEITTAALSNGKLGKTYETKLAANGTAPITWTTASGALPAGLTLAEDGTISGTPTALGAATFTANAHNDWGDAEKELTLTITEVLAPTIQTTNSDLPIGKLKTLYTATLTAKGSADIKWTKVSGTLPNGLTLSPDGSGHISGTPTREGAFTFKVKAKNGEGEDTKELTIKVGDVPVITTTTETLPGAVVNANYSATLTATGTKTITWHSDNLPSWLKLAANGRLTGKPTAVTPEGSPHKFTVTATNAIGEAAPQTLELVVGTKPKITTTALPGGVAGGDYGTVRLEATGTSPITWTWNGKLPDWLSLSSDGTLSRGNGTPPKKGTYSITVKATNKMGFVTKALKIVIADPPVITTETLTGAVVGKSYSFTLKATGKTPITWSVDSGDLPPGITLAANGRLSGKPTVQDTYRFTVAATNVTGKVVTKDLTLIVGTKPVIMTAATLPGGVAGEYYDVQLVASGDPEPVWEWNGTQPDWLTLESDGHLYSTAPAKKGTYNVKAKATNGVGSVTRAFRIVVK